jgi:vanillin dehydrogenase
LSRPNLISPRATPHTFGGVKASGYGRFGGKAGIAEFSELRWITIETGSQHYPI